MRRRPIGILGTALLLAPLFGAGPCAIFPGGRLDGEVVSTPPSDWSHVGDSVACDVEMSQADGDARSVRATCLQRDGMLYVRSMGAPAKTWPALVERDDQVRVRIDGRIYVLRAVRLEGVDERIAVLGGSPEDPPGDSLWLWRLDPR